MYKQVKVTVNMDAKTLFRYMLANTGFGFAGKIRWGVSLMALVLFPFSLFLENKMIGFALLIIIAMYLVVQPGLLFASAKKQMIDNPIFKKEMVYTFDETGVALNQTLDSGMMPWEDILIIREIKLMFLVYLQPGRALVVPKKEMTEDALVLLREVIQSSGIKCRLRSK